MRPCSPGSLGLRLHEQGSVGLVTRRPRCQRGWCRSSQLACWARKVAAANFENHGFRRLRYHEWRPDVEGGVRHDHPRGHARAVLTTACRGQSWRVVRGGTIRVIGLHWSLCARRGRNERSRPLSPALSAGEPNIHYMHAHTRALPRLGFAEQQHAQALKRLPLLPDPPNTPGELYYRYPGSPQGREMDVLWILVRYSVYLGGGEVCFERWRTDRTNIPP